MINCPQCQTSVSEADKECPQCGILFSKWQERENNISSGNLSKYQAIAQATSQEFNWTILIIVAIAVAGLITYMAQNAKEALG